MFRKLTLSVSLSTVMITCATAGPLYDHQVLLTGVRSWSLAYLNNRGDWAANAHGTGSAYPFLNGERYGMDIAGVTGGLIRGLNDRGDVLFQAHSADRGGQNTVFLNGVSLSRFVTTPEWGEDSGVALNENGIAVWNRAIYPYSIAVKHDTPLSQGATFEPYAAVRGINNAGQAIWTGFRTATLRSNLYIDGTLVSGGILPDYYGITSALIADTGDWVAEWEKGRSGGTRRIIKNGVDLSAEVLWDGNGYFTRLGGISTAGHVLWEANFLYDPEGGSRIYVDYEDVSSPVVGAYSDVEPYAINGQGVPLWDGGVYGQSWSHNLYAGSANVSQDLFGPGWSTHYGYLWGFDINDRGQVLWAYQVGTYNWTLYLSTPVPEPASLLLLLPGVVPMAASRQRRGRCT